MRGTLLATTILAGASVLAAAAHAADGGPVEITIGGYMQAYANYASQSDGVGPDGVSGTADDAPGTNRRNFGFMREGEIHFNGRTVLDNGLKVGVHVELEAEDDVDQIDESYLWMENNLGRIQYGKAHPASYIMFYGAPTPVDGLGINTPNFLPVNPSNTAGVGNMISTPATYVGVQKVETLTYFTPRFVGIQLGVSYTPTACQAGNTGNNPCGGSYTGQQLDNVAGQAYDGLSIGANYVNSFGAFDVGVYAGYNQADNGVSGGAVGTNTGDPSQWGAGASIGYMGFTLGGGYRSSTNIGLVQDMDGNDWNMGLTYETGPWTFGGQYGQSEAKLAGRTDDFQGGMVGGMYTLGPGINLNAALQYFDWSTNSSNAAIKNAATNEAWNVMLGTSITF
ncbi:MAG: porin [Sneathiellaceae bacterium]